MGWVDIWCPAFVDRLAAFARAAAEHFREMTDAVPFWCPVNEISFLASAYEVLNLLDHRF